MALIISKVLVKWVMSRLLAALRIRFAKGLVSFAIDGQSGVETVEQLNRQGIRTHVRKADHYSGNILTPLGLETCVRVSLCHYNTKQEVAQFLGAVQSITQGA